MPTPHTQLTLSGSPVLVGTVYPALPGGITAPSSSGGRTVFQLEDMRDKTHIAFFGTANNEAFTARIFKVHRTVPTSGTTYGHTPEYVGDIDVTIGNIAGAGPTANLYMADTLVIGTTYPADATATVISPTGDLPATLRISNTGEKYLVIDGYKASDPVRYSVGQKPSWSE